jgi:hypothetical protein
MQKFAAPAASPPFLFLKSAKVSQFSNLHAGFPKKQNVTIFMPASCGAV